MTRFSPFTTLITVLASLALVCASPGGPPASYVYLCNCWEKAGTGGAQSQVAFYSGLPTNDMTQPYYESIVTDKSNYEWEQGGTVEDGLNISFVWVITNSNATVNTTAGFATYSSSCYSITRSTNSRLYTTLIAGVYKYPFDCMEVYSAKLLDENSTCSSPSAALTTATQAIETTQPTQINTDGAATARPTTAGLSMAAQIGISIGASIVIILFFAVFLIVRQHRLRKKQILGMNTMRAVELQGSPKDAAFLRSKSMGTFSSPTSTISELPPDFRVELHPDTMIEMADTDRGLAHMKSSQYQQDLSPAPTLTPGGYTVSPYQ